MISILILTKNEEQDLPGCLESVSWSDDIHVFDSLSNDKTVDIATKAGAKVTRRQFDNWSDHQNWALKNIRFKHGWVFYIDADERLSPGLANALKEFREGMEDVAAYQVRRRDFAWNGRWLKYTQISPYYLRLFRPDKMRYERLVNPVSVPDGRVERLDGYLDHFPFSKGMKWWWQRHLGYADLEAEMRVLDMKRGTRFSWSKALFGSNFNERRYHQKGIFYKLPVRPLIKWLYLIFIRRAFMDGRAGITYSTLQSIYEYFIILRTRELIRDQKKGEEKHKLPES